MTNGTSQGLFIVVAIVIFGIFVALSHTIFGDQLSNGLTGLFDTSTEQAETMLTLGKDYSINGDFSDYREVNYGWDESLNGNLAPNGNWSRGYNDGVSNPEIGYHAHLDIDTFGYPVMSFKTLNNEVDGVSSGRWMGISQRFNEDTEFYQKLKPGSELVVIFDSWADNTNGSVRVGLYSRDPNRAIRVVPNVERIYTRVSEENTWEQKEVVFSIPNDFQPHHDLSLYFHSYYESGITKYIDNVRIHIRR